MLAIALCVAVCVSPLKRRPSRREKSESWGAPRAWWRRAALARRRTLSKNAPPARNADSGPTIISLPPQRQQRAPSHATPTPHLWNPRHSRENHTRERRHAPNAKTPRCLPLSLSPPPRAPPPCARACAPPSCARGWPHPLCGSHPRFARPRAPHQAPRIPPRRERGAVKSEESRLPPPAGGRAPISTRARARPTSPLPPPRPRPLSGRSRPSGRQRALPAAAAAQITRS